MVARGETQQHDPEGDRRDDERREARGHGPFAQGHQSIPAGEEQDAHERRASGLAPRHAQRAPVTRGDPEGEHETGEEEAHACGEERRHRLHDDRDGKIGGAPDEIDDAERDPDHADTSCLV